MTYPHETTSGEQFGYNERAARNFLRSGFAVDPRARLEFTAPCARIDSRGWAQTLTLEPEDFSHPLFRNPASYQLPWPEEKCVKGHRLLDPFGENVPRAKRPHDLLRPGADAREQALAVATVAGSLAAPTSGSGGNAGSAGPIGDNSVLSSRRAAQILHTRGASATARSALPPTQEHSSHAHLNHVQRQQPLAEAGATGPASARFYSPEYVRALRGLDNFVRPSTSAAARSPHRYSATDTTFSCSTKQPSASLSSSSVSSTLSTTPGWFSSGAGSQSSVHRYPFY